MSTPEKHEIFLAAEDAFESEVIGAVAMAAAEQIGATTGRAAEHYITDLRAIAAGMTPDAAWERYGSTGVDALISDVDDLRVERAR